MKVAESVLKRNNQLVAALREDRQPWWEHWGELAKFYLPRRYIPLLTSNDRKRIKSKNPFILDGTGTQASKTLAAGMMNGITSPTRPWFKLRLSGFQDDVSSSWRKWLDDTERRMFMVMKESNFYNTMAVMYNDLNVFATASMLIYEDDETVVHCQNNALGEFYLGQDGRGRVNVFAREIVKKVYQVVDEFGLENCSPTVQDAYKRGGDALMVNVFIRHLIEPNDDREGKLPRTYQYREFYWEISGNSVDTGTANSMTMVKDGQANILSVRGYREKPMINPRWEIIANDSYGSSCPGMEALGDVIQLQHETKAKAKGLDNMNRPPMLADVSLEHKPIALIPGGVTFTHSLQRNTGMRPAYEVRPPISEISQDIAEVRARVREFFHNDLFKMISQLDTVRSATEIDARKEEKLVLLGPVLDRFESEALRPSIARIYAIMERKGLLLDPPEEIVGAKLEVQYVSILSVAQRAISAAPTERLVGMVGNVAGARPDALDNINWDELVRDYGSSLGVPERYFTDEKQVEAIRQQRAQQQESEQAMIAAREAADGAKVLSETEVGGGANALQRLFAG